jgi:tetratricopeptide (TPR) repeat protein
MEYYGRAIQEEEPSSGDQWRLSFKMGESLRRKGLYQEAGEFFTRSLALLEDSRTGVERALLLDRLGSVQMNTGHPEEGLRSCFQAYELIRDSKHHSEVAEVLNRIAITYMRLGYPREAREFFLDALATFRRVNHSLGICCCYTNLGLLAKNACRFEEALELSHKGLEIAREHSLYKWQLNLQLNMGIILFKMHRDREASRRFQRARRLARRCGEESLLVSSTLSLGRVQARLGHHQRAEAFLLEGKARAERNGQKRSAVLADEFLGELAWFRGDLRAAESNFRSALADAEILAPRGDLVVEVLQRLSSLLQDLGREGESLLLAERGLKLAELNGELYEIPFLLWTRARATASLGDRSVALTGYRDSLRAFEKSRNPVSGRKARYDFSRFLMESGSQEDLLRARKILDRLLASAREEHSEEEIFQASLLMAGVEAGLGSLEGARLALMDAEAACLGDPSSGKRSKLEELRSILELPPPSAEACH